MSLLNLAPDIQEQILDLPAINSGRAIITERTLRPVVAELDWGTQRVRWGEVPGCMPSTVIAINHPARPTPSTSEEPGLGTSCRYITGWHFGSLLAGNWGRVVSVGSAAGNGRVLDASPDKATLCSPGTAQGGNLVAVGFIGAFSHSMAGFRQGLMCRESCVHRPPPSLSFFARREVRMRLQTEQKWLSCNKNLLGC